MSDTLDVAESLINDLNVMPYTDFKENIANMITQAGLDGPNLDQYVVHQ